MRIIFLLLVCLLLSQYIQAQTNSTSTFDSIYYNTYEEVLGMNSDEALIIVDSLYQSSNSGLLKMRAMFISANIYGAKNNLIFSIQSAKKAYEFALKEQNYNWQSRICVYLSTQYRNIGLLVEGREYINKALKISRKVSGSREQKIQLVLIEQELAQYALLEKKFEDLLVHVSNSDNLLEDLGEFPNHLYQRISGDDLRGRAYLGLGLYEEAKKSFLKGLTFIKSLDHGGGYLAGYIYMGLGEVFAASKNDSLAFNYYHFAEIPAKKSNHIALELALYKQIANLYKRNEDWELFNAYSDKYESLRTIDRNLRRAAVQNEFIVSKEENEKSEAISRIYLGGITVLIIFITAFLLWFNVRKNKESQTFVDNIKTGTRLVESQMIQGEKNGIPKKKVLSIEAELKILECLKRFEEELEFLKPTTSLACLALFCDTNTRYLSYVLNQNIGKDFNSYINKLRIDYAVEKLENDPVFRTYKISYVADFLGFSSHSKFTAVFKEIMDIAPSSFIEQLEKEKRE